MGFKDVLKKMGNTTKKVADRATKEIKWQKRIGEAKREILTRFTVKQLERIASTKGISLYEEDILTGERTRLRTKGEIVRRLSSRLGFNEVVDLARRYKVRYSDVVQELENYRQRLFGENKQEKSDSQIIEEVSQFERGHHENLGDIQLEDDSDKSEDDIFFEKVVKSLREFKQLAPARGEKSLKEQVVGWLAREFGVDKVVTEYTYRDGRVDLLVNGNIGIELKIADSRRNLRELVGQIEFGKDYFKYMIAVIFDTGDYDLDYYEKKIKDKGAEVVVIPAKIRRRGRKKEIIVVSRGRGRIIIQQ